MPDPDPQVALDWLAERFAALESCLRDAQKYVGGDDSGLQAAKKALFHLQCFLDSFDNLRPLSWPLLSLAEALLDVDDGSRAAMFEPAPKAGNKKFTQRKNRVKVCALIAVEAERAGGKKLEDKVEEGGKGSRDNGAYAFVAKAFTNVGCEVTKRSLRNWRSRSNGGKDPQTERRVSLQIMLHQQNKEWPTTLSGADKLVKQLAQAASKAAT